jgi:hypothetical protein
LNYIKTNLKTPTPATPKQATPKPVTNINPNNNNQSNSSFYTVNAKNDVDKNKADEKD